MTEAASDVQWLTRAARAVATTLASVPVNTIGANGTSISPSGRNCTLYLRAMAEVAWKDGVVTGQERADLDTVAGMLGLSSPHVDAALADARESAASTSVVWVGDEDAPQPTVGSGGSALAALTTAGIGLEPGDRVVFTGAMCRERSEWEALARRRGFEPGGVRKRTKIVVAADPNSLSGKAGKARSYGVPIVTEAAFERPLGCM